jgi:uncharacterized protein (UPF0332 family)
VIDDISLLFEKAEQSIDAARLLHSQKFFPFSVSRAYYAMFYAAEALLTSLGLSYSSHGAVIGGFGREFAKTELLKRKYHRWLIDAHDMRSMGDYGVGDDISGDDSAEMISRAAEFVEIAIEFYSNRGDKI